MSEFDEYTQGRTTPYQQESSGAQTNKPRNAVARIETCPRLPAHTGSAVATLDSDVTLRFGPGLLHAPPDCHPDGRPATGEVPVVSNAHDPCPADVDEDQYRKWQENDACSDVVGRPTPAQPLPAGAVAPSPKGARSTNPEIFRRGWKSAGPPHPGLLPDMDNSDGANATRGAQGLGPRMDLSLRRDENEYGENEKVTFETPICGQRARTSDGYAPGRVQGAAYGDQPRRRMDDMTTDYDHDAHAASYDAPQCADDDVESGYVPGRVSDGYTRALDAAARRAMPRRASDGAVTQILQVGRTSDTGFGDGYAPGGVSDYAPDSYERASACRLCAGRACRCVATF